MSNRLDNGIRIALTAHRKPGTEPSFEAVCRPLVVIPEKSYRVGESRECSKAKNYPRRIVSRHITFAACAKTTAHRGGGSRRVVFTAAPRIGLVAGFLPAM
jgi:hypothetical protein